MANELSISGVGGVGNGAAASAAGFAASVGLSPLTPVNGHKIEKDALPASPEPAAGVSERDLAARIGVPQQRISEARHEAEKNGRLIWRQAGVWFWSEDGAQWAAEHLAAGQRLVVPVAGTTVQAATILKRWVNCRFVEVVLLNGEKSSARVRDNRALRIGQSIKVEFCHGSGWQQVFRRNI